MPRRIKLSCGAASTVPPFTTKAFEAEASVMKPSRNMIVSTAPASTDSWRASTLPRSEIDFTWFFFQRKSSAVTQATPFSTISFDGEESG